jgi:tetraacyldisaccharide 4'-kinase
MEQRLTELWYGSARSGPVLRALSRLYGAVTALRTHAYAAGWLARQQAGKPVVVVGNLTVGGTGKTPLVAWLAQKLTARGLKVGIVSRGHGRRGHAPQLVTAASSWREVGDEPLLLCRRTGCLTVVGRDRVAAVRELVAHGVDVVIADDGLQHLRLSRSCEIVVVDGSRGFGNGQLLPAGPLREPTTRLTRVDLTVINGPVEHASLARFAVQLPAGTLTMTTEGSEACRVDGAGAPRMLDTFRGGRVHAVAGIGNPARFFRELRERGLDTVEHAFADHHAFEARDFEFGDSLPVIMTEKDAVKCGEFADARLWYVPITARFGELHEQRLLDCVLHKTGLPAAAGG